MFEESNLRITTAGVGGAWAPAGIWQNQVVVEIACHPDKYLLDCGSDARHSLAQAKVDDSHIKCVVISHLHGDHVDGLEWLGFKRFCFNQPKIDLYAPAILHAGLAKVFKTKMGDFEDGRSVEFSDYFNLKASNPFRWYMIDCSVPDSWSLSVMTIPVPHVNKPELFEKFPNSAAFAMMLRLSEGGSRTATALFTNDCRFCPDILMPHMEEASIIFHDAGSPRKGGVHASLEEIETLPEHIRKKTIIYHSTQVHKDLGMVKGQAKPGDVFTVPYDC